MDHRHMLILATSFDDTDPLADYDPSLESNSIVVNADEFSYVDKRSSKYRAKLHRDWLLTLKLGKSCVDCNLLCEINNYPAFHWDHLPQYIKLFEISESSRKSRTEVMREIEKCELRCANCHAIITYERKYGTLTGRKAHD